MRRDEDDRERGRGRGRDRDGRGPRGPRRGTRPRLSPAPAARPRRSRRSRRRAAPEPEAPAAEAAPEPAAEPAAARAEAEPRARCGARIARRAENRLIPLLRLDPPARRGASAARGAYTRRRLKRSEGATTSGEHQPGDDHRQPDRDPELRTLPSGTAVCELGVAVNHRRKDNATDQWVEEPNYFNVVVFGAQGRELRPVPLEGPAGGGRRPSPVELVGGQERRRQALEGRDRRQTVQFLGSRGDDTRAAAAPARAARNQGFAAASDVPADTSDFGGPPPASAGGGGSDDDIPF